MIHRLSIIACILLLASGAAADDRFCENNFFTIDARYEAGAFDKCKFKSHNTVELTIRAEDHKVDVEQPWYSFRITSHQPREITVRLKFPDAYARYWPKLSKDGKTWTRATDDAVRVSKNKKNMDVTLQVNAADTWVSAQELVTQAFYDQWFEELAAHEEIQTAVIGKSVEGRPIQIAKNDNKKEVIFLLGRQHPAEVPGALVLRDFVSVILGDSDLARQFRERFTLLIIPLINPDGVANGHWRHNARRTDLNRDWGPFKQPETQAVAKLLAAVDKLDMQPRLMLDFHATKETASVLFYTQIPEDVTNPPDFTNNWLARVHSRIPDYEFKNDPRPTSKQPNTKGYFYKRYGIPSVTYEIGGEADREKLREVTPVFAEELMRTLLGT